MLRFGSARKPTSSSSEASTSMAEGTMPWQVGSSKSDESQEHFKYQYHPGGDKKKGLKNAPGALNTVIIPNVTLTKVGRLQSGAGRDQSRLVPHHTETVRAQAQHDKFNKWGKDGY